MNGSNKKHKSKRSKKNKKSNNDGKSNPKTNTEKSKDVHQIQNIPTSIVSSSPRPCSLLKSNTEFVATRNSGSDYDEFQTPSIEYEIKYEGLDENTPEEFGSNYDNEWDHVGSFENDHMGDISEQDKKNENVDSCDGDFRVKDKCFAFCNGDVVRVQTRSERLFVDCCKIANKDEDVQVTEIETEKDYVVDQHDNEMCIKRVDKLFEYFENDHLEDISEQDKKNENMDTRVEDFTVKDKGLALCNGYVVRVQSSSERLFVDNCKIANKDDDGKMIVDVEVTEIETEKDQHDNERFVDTFFGSLEEECSNYPINKEGLVQMSKNMVQECNVEPDHKEAINTKSSCCIDEPYLETSMKEDEDEQNKEHIDENVNLLCTEENLKEETLSFSCIMLEVRNEPSVQKSMTLRPRHSEGFFEKSATSNPNTLSVSFDNIPLNVEKENKSIKKKPFKIYQNFIKKFRKEKTPEKEEVKNETLDHNLSLKSGDFIKDSEIESNQSLKSINSFGNNSQFFCETVAKDMAQTEQVADVEDGRIINIFTDINILAEETQSVPTVKKKNEKSELFKNILRKKHPVKKVLGERISVELTLEKEEKTPSRRAEIEMDVLLEYNEAVKSLRCCDKENEGDATVIIKEKRMSHTNVPSGTVDDSKERHFNGGDDHLFPDAITATKISSCQSPDIPYMDDPVIYQNDAKSFFNGESKRLRISPEYCVPMASMESLFFPDDSMRNHECQAANVSQSPCRRKRVLGSFLRIISKGR